MKNNASKESNTGSFLAGFLMGGLAGAAIALIFAPQSGVNTRGQVTDFAVKRTSGATTPTANGFSTNGHHVKQSDADESDEQPRIILDNGTTSTSNEDEPAD